MALVQIQPTVRRQNEESTMDKIAKGFSIAQSALGTALAIPKFLQDRKTEGLQQAKLRTDVMQQTEAAQPGDEGAFEVPGIEGVRKAMPSLAREIEKLNIGKAKSDAQERERRAKKLTDEQRLEIANFAKAQGVNKLPEFSLPLTIGESEDFIKTTLAAGARNASLELATLNSVRQQKKEEREILERENALMIPALGQKAKSLTDQKEVTEALDSSQNILSGLDTLVALKEKYGSGAIPMVNSEDIARANQISTDLLLQYKSLAKLGVLSQSDLQLINSLIPNKPLSYEISSRLFGQSPIMARLKQLEEMVKNRRNSFIKNRGLNYAPLLSDQELEALKQKAR